MRKSERFILEFSYSDVQTALLNFAGFHGRKATRTGTRYVCDEEGEFNPKSRKPVIVMEVDLEVNEKSESEE